MKQKNIGFYGNLQQNYSKFSNCICWFALMLFVSCKLQARENHQDSIKYQEFPLSVSVENSLMAKWEKKPVLESRIIDDMETDAGWHVAGIGQMAYTTDIAKDGKRSLQFKTSLRDEAHLKKYRSEWNSFNGGQGGSTSIQLKFDTPQDWSAFNRISFWVYVHATSMPTYSFEFHFQNEGTVANATYPYNQNHVHDLKSGQWNHVLFEMHHLERNKVNEFQITQTLRGHNPEEEGIVTYNFDRIEIQKVDADQYEGWTVAPGKFSFCHTGYRPHDSKIAMVGSGAGNTFQLIDSKNTSVFEGKVNQIVTKNGVFNRLDFSEFQKKGNFRIRCGKLESDPFPIDEKVWDDPLHKAVNFFFCQRCGFNVPGVHTECHLDWQGFNGDTKKIINGGWHDAGDLSQGYFRTAFAVFAMIRNFENLQNKEDAKLAAQVRSEIEWGLDWLLKTRFGNGFHASWSVMRIYTDNKIGTLDDVVSPARNIPWENFLASAVLAKSSQIFSKINPELAGKAREAAIEDWKAAMASREKWDKAEYREASWGAISSLLLGQISGEKTYYQQAANFGNLLVQCQEQRFVDGIPISGYFYEQTDRKKVIHNFHHSFEESPIIALAMLCKSLPQHDNFMDWYSAVVLHSEFFMKRGSVIAAPYNLLPNSVWKKSEIMAETKDNVREDKLRQFNDGTQLNNDYVLRTFPIYHDNLFHGNTMIQMASTWALAEASDLRNDQSGMALVGRQLEWVLGNNPFGQSLMYGVGYNFAPQFAYCLKNIVGSLPVGMDCMSGDQPYWSATNSATHKEIWVEPVNRFMGAVAVYSNPDQKKPKSESLQIRAEKVVSANGKVTALVTFSGSGKHHIEIKTWNTENQFSSQQIDLSKNHASQIQLELKISDTDKPCVAVIIANNNPALRCEIIGSSNNSDWLSKNN